MVRATSSILATGSELGEKGFEDAATSRMEGHRTPRKRLVPSICSRDTSIHWSHCCCHHRTKNTMCKSTTPETPSDITVGFLGAGMMASAIMVSVRLSEAVYVW